MSRARTSDDIWWTRIFDRLDEFLHNYPKLPKNSVTENNEYKFRFQLNSDEVDIIGMASTVHEDIVVRLQEFFKVPNNGVVDDPPIVVSGQVRHYVPGGNRDEMSPDACVRPNMTFVPKPTTSTVIPRPPGDKSGNPHARIMCEVAVSQSVGELGRKCLTWMQEPYVRAAISIKILEPRQNMREPTTGQTLPSRNGSTTLGFWEH
ncbi:hypothetical protein RhiirA4_412447 [Rhizophagus irregularis]|uniref:Uncharacterized protein n=1 Tax=Rhizophagus irregularis TaxID=588596 RepID=A0A2I1HBQ2_9GLOM|nr:hypothetical protein RhiirA4_411085 [Rhizophagus irregularis]PKY59517.1 hypothetical protein RhiirA4_412447 [Rhizophagus irregularis]